MRSLQVRWFLCFLLCLGANGFQFRDHSNYAVKDSHPVPSGWRQVRRAAPDHIISLSIGLKQGDLDTLENHLLHRSNHHNGFRNHLSANVVNELMKPSESAIVAVQEWLTGEGFNSKMMQYSPAKDWIHLDLRISEVERLLRTRYHQYVSEDGLVAVRAPEWSLPIHLHEHIETIQPTNSFFSPRPQIRLSERDGDSSSKPTTYDQKLNTQLDTSTVSAACNISLITPHCLRTLYRTVNYTVSSNKKNTIAMTDYLGQVNLRSDTDLYLRDYRPEAVSAAQEFKQISIAGGTTSQTLNSTQLQQGLGHEGNLDNQLILGVAWPTPLVVYSTGGSPPIIPDINVTRNTNEPYLVWLNYILAQPDPLPPVISTSYDDYEQTVPKDYAKRVCNGFAQLGARGVTVIFSSGDSGVGPSGQCYTNDGTNRTMFIPKFPSTCPWVTSVGATHQVEPEVAAFNNVSGHIYASGGGFSNYFARPLYQNSAVFNYLKDQVRDKYSGLYNPAGRAYPDVSAQGQFLAVYYNGSLARGSGTSASAPITAGVLSLVNDALITAGRPTLGFINPWLYSVGYKAFNDILSGSSYGCNTTGFSAAKGWDPVTGMGTPDFTKILDLLGLGKRQSY